MKTLFVVEATNTRVAFNSTREFLEGETFHLNGLPHLVESVTTEDTKRVVYLAEAPRASQEDKQHKRKRRRGGRATQEIGA